MKKTSLIVSVAALSSLCAFSLAMFVGCTVEETTAESYTVTVTGGSGGGVYEAGEQCTVEAELSEGEIFVQWIDGAGTEVSRDNPYIFTVDSDVNLTAVTETVTTYTITVTGGYINGTELSETTVCEGETVSVSAPDSQSRPFKYWIINGSEQSEDNPYIFTAEEDVNLVAVTDEVCLVAVSGGTLGDGESRHKYNVGEECTIVADEAPEGQTFIYWYVVDENGNKKSVSEDTEYTFTVTETEKYYAYFGYIRTVTVNGGVIAGTENQSTAEIADGGSCTVKLDPEMIPEGKGFVCWDLGGGKTAYDQEYRIAYVTSDMNVNAVYGDLIKFDTPEMSANQMFRYKNDYRPLEFDRGSVSAFADNVDYIKFYIYTSSYADKDDYIGSFIMDNNGTARAYRLATADGVTLLELEGVAGNIWLETKNGYTKSQLFDMFEKVLGDAYDSKTPYYLAAQVCGGLPYSVYSPSDISEIGPMAFIAENIASYSVTVSGGFITGTEITEAVIYAGQNVSVTATDAEIFKYWLVNGAEEVDSAVYEFTVTQNVQLVAVYDEVFLITVNGGTIGGADTQKNVISGNDCTIIAQTAADGQAFVCWYVLNESGEVVIVSEDAEYTFKAMKSETFYAKYANVYKLTVNGGYVAGYEDIGGVVEVLEGSSYTVVPNIPENKGFVEWQADGVKVSDVLFYTLTDISGDITVTAVFGDLQYLFDAPEMAANQMFSHNDSYSIIELDRMKESDGTTKRTAFTDNVEYIMFYIYTTPYAAKDEYVGRFILDMHGTGSEGVFRLATVDGRTLLNLKGKAGDVYLDGYSRARLFTEVFAAAIGEEYGSKIPYYLAAQVCGINGSVYAPSEISEIGTQVFIAENISTYTVSVEGGVITGTDLTVVTVYDGRPVSITATSEDVVYWIVNGTDKAVGSTFVYYPKGDATIIAGYDGQFTLTVSGGTVSGSEDAQITVRSGDECTIVAGESTDGKQFSHWYVLEDGQEITVSRDAEYTFWAFSDQTYYAKFVNVYTITVVYDTDVENISVLEGQSYTVSIGADKIPEGKGFVEWEINGAKVSAELTYELSGISENVTLTAVFGDLQYLFSAPLMDQNQMFKHNESYSILEFDRGGSTAFTEHVEYIMFYIYTSADADKDDYVGRFIMDRNTTDGSFRLATVDGETLLELEGAAGNLWLQTKNSYNKRQLFDMLAKVIGESYSDGQGYYLAAQTCGAECSVYAPSEISEIGPSEFKYN